MTVYVDDMFKSPMGRFGRMKMSHMVADSDKELHKMAATIGVARRHWQSPEKTSGSHYDVAMVARSRAVANGAVEVTLRQLAAMNFRRRQTGELGKPEDAEQWMKEWYASKSS